MSGATTLRPGSTAWLLRHEIRLAMRGNGSRMRILLGLAVAGSVGLHYGAWKLMSLWPAGALPPMALYLLGGAAWFCVLLMLSQAIVASVMALFDRGDLDLLLSSPMPTGNVFAARGLGIVASVPLLYVFLLAPIADVGLFMGHPNLLAIYPTLLGLALLVSSLGLALTLGLVRLLGARRTRSVAQVISSLVGAAIFLCLQANTLLGPEKMRGVFAQLARWAQPGGPLALDAPVWLPGRALMGDLRAMAVIFAVGSVAFVAVVRLAHRRFLAGTQESMTGGARRGAVPVRAGAARFRGGLWRTMLVKEWRLIVRDPQVISQTLMQVIYMLPMMFLIARNSKSLTPMLVPAVVYLACSLATNIAWITVAAEESPELLGTAPVPLERLRWMKIFAALLPVWALVAPLAAWLAGRAPLEALILVACTVLGTLSVGASQIWYPRQGKRGDLKKRAQGAGALGIVELVGIASWAWLAWCLGASLAWAPAAAAGIVIGSGAVWALGRTPRERAAAGQTVVSGRRA